jgi:hypothetical protein
MRCYSAGTQLAYDQHGLLRPQQSGTANSSCPASTATFECICLLIMQTNSRCTTLHVKKVINLAHNTPVRYSSRRHNAHTIACNACVTTAPTPPPVRWVCTYDKYHHLIDHVYASMWRIMYHAHNPPHASNSIQNNSITVMKCGHSFQASSRTFYAGFPPQIVHRTPTYSHGWLWRVACKGKTGLRRRAKRGQM